MAVTFDSARWEALAAERTRGDVGDGIASVLALLGRSDVISFAGGFPDPETFPRELRHLRRRECVRIRKPAGEGDQPRPREQAQDRRDAVAGTGPSPLGELPRMSDGHLPRP
jgi:hypothetical protein